MSKNTETKNAPITEKQLIAALNALLEKDALDKPFIALLDRLFTEGKWEIPDDAVAGKYAHKVATLEAQVLSLTNLLAQVAAEVRGETPPPTGRVDAVAVATAKPAKKGAK